MKIETIEQLEQLLAERDETIAGLVTIVGGLGEFAKAQELKIRLQQGLIDKIWGVLIENGLAERRPKEDPGLAN